MEPKTADWRTAAAFQDMDGNNFLVGTKQRSPGSCRRELGVIWLPA